MFFTIEYSFILPQPLFQNRFQTQSSRKATYQDLQRTYSQVEPNHLEALTLATATLSASATALTQREKPNLFQKAVEAEHNEDGGRRLGSAIDLTGEKSNLMDESQPTILSLLSVPPLFGIKPSTDDSGQVKRAAGVKPEKSEDGKTNDIEYKMLGLPVESERSRIAELSGKAMRKFLEIREKVKVEEKEIASLEHSMVHQNAVKKNLVNTREKLIAGPKAADPIAFSAQLDEIKESEKSCERVQAQVGNRLSQVYASSRDLKKALKKAKLIANETFKDCCKTVKRYQDPFSLSRRSTFTGTRFDNNFSKNRLAVDFLARQAGVSLCRNQLSGRQIGRPLSVGSASEVRKSIIASRFSHSVTLSAHLTYPIYCLQFDKSGRYFVTGADDCLVKLFYLGAKQSSAPQSGSKTFSYGSNGRAAILVCALRGHAGVICDMDVSADNAMLATASDDGDVRIWGMKDGCPIAILRGHHGGANMVSF